MPKKNLKVDLLVIDPNKDFLDITGSALPVTGANKDMDRVASLIKRVGRRLNDIRVTLDSHRTIDVGHSPYWVDRDGNHPAPFTLIPGADIEAGILVPCNPAWLQDQIDSAKRREAAGKKTNMVWPTHCLIGSVGWTVHDNLFDALKEWESREIADVDYVTKGSYPHREHYGALMAEDPDPREPDTALNTSFLAKVQAADIVGITGEALSHCVMETINQIAQNIGQEHIKKFHILTDCSSPVAKVGNGPDFPALAASWLKDMEKLGMTLTTSKEFLA